MSELHARIKELRLKNNINPEKMAEILNTTLRNYQRYENGNVKPPTSKIIFLANYFDVSIDYLVGRSENPIKQYPFKQNI